MSYPILQDIEPIAALLPIRSAIVTLKILEPFQIGMLHHVPLHAWLRTLAQSPEDFSKGLVIEPLENSHYQYEANDLYRFRLTITSEGVSMLSLLFDKLQKLPTSAGEIAKEQTFNSNVVLHAIHDTFSGDEVTDVYNLLPLKLESLAEQIYHLESVTKFDVQFLTPVLLVKADTAGKKGPERFCRDKKDFSWSLLNQRISDTFIHLIQTHTGQRHTRPEWNQGKIDKESQVAIWMEYRYGRKNRGQKFSGGALTSFTLELEQPLDRVQWALLLLGQYLGIGQSRGFGLGIYQISIDDHIQTVPRPTPAHSLLSKAMTDQNLDESVQHTQKKHGFSKAKYKKFRGELGLNAQKALELCYEPPALIPVEIPKKNGETRHLSIPPIEDRMLQRTATKLLSDTFDTHWMKRSYGYRAGHSRLNARDDINRLIQQGYEWIVEADVKSFFDNVDWENVEKRLQLLFPNEPLVKLIMQWVKAPILNDDGSLSERVKGLPQGAPVSPMLANLILDDFDADMQTLGYEIIRYADDFVLLFKKEEDANEALNAIQVSLNEHLLHLNPLKTKVVHYTKGFRFLGYFFIDGYAIETSANIENIGGLTHIPQPQIDPITVELDSEIIGEREFRHDTHYFWRGCRIKWL